MKITLICLILCSIAFTVRKIMTKSRSLEVKIFNSLFFVDIGICKTRSWSWCIGRSPKVFQKFLDTIDKNLTIFIFTGAAPVVLAADWGIWWVGLGVPVGPRVPVVQAVLPEHLAIVWLCELNKDRTRRRKSVVVAVKPIQIKLKLKRCAPKPKLSMFHSVRTQAQVSVSILILMLIVDKLKTNYNKILFICPASR